MPRTDQQIEELVAGATPRSFAVELWRRFDMLEKHSRPHSRDPDGDLLRERTETLRLIEALEEMPYNIQPPPSPDWCKAVRSAINALSALGNELVSSSKETRGDRCRLLVVHAAEAIRNVETVGWSLPKQVKSSSGESGNSLGEQAVAMAPAETDPAPEFSADTAGAQLQHGLIDSEPTPTEPQGELQSNRAVKACKEAEPASLGDQGIAKPAATTVTELAKKPDDPRDTLASAAERPANRSTPRSLTFFAKKIMGKSSARGDRIKAWLLESHGLRRESKTGNKWTVLTGGFDDATLEKLGEPRKNTSQS